MKDKKKKYIDITAKDIDTVREYLNKLLNAENNDNNKGIIKLVVTIVDTYLSVVQILSKKKTSIQKLKNFIFGNKKEKSKFSDLKINDLNNSNSNSSSNNSDNRNPGNGKAGKSEKSNSGKNGNKRKGGNGRIPQEDYDATLEIFCPLCPALRPGEICPECKQHKLYKHEASSTVRMIGSPPIEAIRFIREMSECVCGAIFSGEVAEEYKDLFDSPKYTASSLATILHLKYDIGVPFGSLDKFQRDCGVPLPASTQSNQIRSLSNLFDALFGAIKKIGSNMDIMGMDDTPIKVLEGRETEKGTKTLLGHGTVFLCNNIDSDLTVVLYYFNFEHAGKCLLDLLSIREEDTNSPICICDGAPCYKKYVEESDVVEAKCNAHSRRKFFSDRKTEVLCAIIITCYCEIYKNEKFCRENDMTALERQQFHAKNSMTSLAKLLLVCQFITSPLDLQGLDEIRKKLDVADYVTPSEPNGDLYNNAKYIIDRWEALTNFTRIPGVPIDTNKVENKIKAIIEIRKKGLFFKTLQSAEDAGKILSLIETAHANNKNSLKYFQFAIENKEEVIKNPEKFLPWNYEQHPLYKSKPPFSNHLGKQISPDFHSSIAPEVPLNSSQ